MLEIPIPKNTKKKKCVSDGDEQTFLVMYSNVILLLFQGSYKEMKLN